MSYDMSLRVVARFTDGSMVKGTTRDFSASRPVFHVHPEGNLREPAVAVAIARLKAVFFVKTLAGNKDHLDNGEASDRQGQGRRIQVTFIDGESLVGSLVGYAPDLRGFFLVPTDRDGNNLRIFVVGAAVRKVKLLDE